MTSAVLVTTSGSGRLVAMPGVLRRAAGIAGELLALLGIVFSIPFVILAVGTPIVLCARLLLWVTGMR